MAVIIRRKPSKVWHIMLWNLKNDTISHGSWFTGKLYPLRCDLSWDGGYMSYIAMGADAKTSWNGICEPPFLKTVVEWDNLGTWNGGAIWTQKWEIERNLSVLSEPRILGSWPSKYKFKNLTTFRGEDPSIIFHRLYRDGFRPILKGKSVEPFEKDGSLKEWRAMEEGAVWRCEKSNKLPALTAQYVGYKHYMGLKGTYGRFGSQGGPGYQNRAGYIFRFDLEGHGELLGPEVEWATWASTDDLLYAKDGCVFRLKIARAKELGEPIRIDLNGIDKPPRSGAK